MYAIREKRNMKRRESCMLLGRREKFSGKNHSIRLKLTQFKLLDVKFNLIIDVDI